ncbi:MAG: phosphatase PAP2 family protein [Clostridiales bacterium]|nr:phosphatase PAP2 family protein [Clostridiales bacterium]MDD6260857.1 phosphatase PAP2 family protein [Clostridiales bacterium]MDD7594803.1 phosphatase PAP2 family protein [Clostridiales bacterium]
MDAIYSFDYSILNYINEHFHNAFFDGFFSIITHLADAGWFWIALAALLLCFKKTRKTGCVMGAALLMGVIFGNGILKPLIHRVRPYDNAAWSPAVTRATLLISPPSDYSFPSGHTLASFEGAFGIFLCNKKWGAPALVLAVLIAFSRLYFYIHYPTDVIGGMILGIGFAVAAFFIVGAIWNKVTKKQLPKV